MLLALSLLGSATPTSTRGSAPAARYSPRHPYQLALQADWIVEATILRIDAPRRGFLSRDKIRPMMTLRVHAVIAGTLEGDELEVLQFNDWTCASRYAPYRPGQHSVFHLSRELTPDGELDPDGLPRPIGGGNEGECPIAGDQLLHQAFGWRDTERLEHAVRDVKYRGVATDKVEYVEAVRGLRRCFLWARNPDTPRYFSSYGPTPRVSAEERAAYGRTSPTAARMLANLEKRHDRARSR